MNEILISNGKDISLTTVEIAVETGKRHDNVQRDTKTMLTELYGEDSLLKFEESYTADNGHTYPCYRLPKTELLVLVSGYSIPLRAKIIRRLEQLENHFSTQHIPESKKDDFELQLLGAKYCADILNYSEQSRLELMHSVYETNGVPTASLPDYTKNVRVTFSASDLLKKNGCDISVVAFNKLMMAAGLLEERERTGGGGKIKKFKALTEAGLKWGQNDASKHNPRAVHPHYFEDTFMDLYDLVTKEETAEA